MTWSKVANCLSTWAKAFLNKGQGCSNCSDGIITWCVLTRVNRIGHYIQTQICPCTCPKIDTVLRLKERTEQEVILWPRHLEMILTLGSSSLNFDVGVFIHKRGAHHSLELWISLSLDRTLSFENLSLLVIFSAHKACFLYTFVCMHHRRVQLQLHCDYCRVTRKRSGSASGLTLILHLCHPTARNENNDTRCNNTADLQIWSYCKLVLLLVEKFQESFTNTWESISEILACFMSKPHPLGELYLWKSEWGFR